MSQLSLIVEKQWFHAVALAGLINGVVLIGNSDSIQSGSLWDVGSKVWLRMAVVIAIAHQVLVWFCCRTQLHPSLLTRTLKDNGFTVFAVLFSVLGISRVLVVFILAIANRSTLPEDSTILKIAAILVAIPAVYLFYSVKR